MNEKQSEVKIKKKKNKYVNKRKEWKKEEINKWKKEGITERKIFVMCVQYLILYFPFLA